MLSRIQFGLLLMLNVMYTSTGFCEEMIPLNTDWRFKNTTSNEWYPATVPGVVHLDLWDNGFIENPYEGNNELKQRWIEREDWEYSRTIFADQNLLRNEHIELIFNGLDTYTTILLNGKEILATDNMFRGWMVELKPFLKLGENELRIIFHSPLTLNEANVANSRYELPAANETVDLKVSPYTRKAAYHFGWDWGPRFVTAGIWRSVYLRTWDELKVNDISYTTEKISSSKARINFEFDIYASIANTQIYDLTIENETYKIQIKKGNNRIKQTIEINEFEDWNPKGYGNQWQWNGSYSITSKEDTFATGKLKAAFKKIELIQQKDSIGTSFYFKVNDVPFYAKGANYIPQDMFLPRVDSARYEKLIQQAVNANINMLRVWGGGIYENDYFYELCDANGILVWQDFMFANSMYPASPYFIDNIAKEVEYNVKRLRNHPCIALWCGNNEIEVAWENWGWQNQYNYTAKDSAEIWNNYTSIFHELIPQTLEKLSPNIAYVPTTPISNWGTQENFNHSSMHYWGVWHGIEPLENYAKNIGRFMAEYGYQSYPNYATLAKVIKTEDLHLESAVMKNRQKSYIGNGIIEANVIKYTYEERDFKNWIQLTQIVQAYAYQIAIRNHRTKTPHCMGTLFWQFNDCWPGPSWSVIDYYGNEKIAYSEVKNYYQSIIATIEHDANAITATMVSDRLEDVPVQLEITAQSKNGMTAPILNTTAVLSHLQPQNFFEIIPRKIMHSCRKSRKFSHFNITIKEDSQVIFTTLQ